MNAEDIYYNLSHAWSKDEGMTEVDTPYTPLECQTWMEKLDHPPLTDHVLKELREIRLVPNALIRRRYVAAVEKCSHRSSKPASEFYAGHESELTAINENVREAYQVVSGENLSHHQIVDKLRYSLGLARKGQYTAIFMPREFAEAVVKALSITPHEVGI